jgi:uncharacterized 2Fe-2S/4Fe-4S cluster protein (DUF4445 family)
MTRKFKIEVLPQGIVLEASGDETLKAVLNAHEIYFPQTCEGKGECGGCRVKFISPAPEMLRRERELFGEGSSLRLACLHKPDRDMKIFVTVPRQWASEKAISDFKIEPGGEGYGLAVDLGTTTVAVYLVDLGQGEVVTQYSFLNPQIHFGADVMTRLAKAMQPGGREKLSIAIRQGLANVVLIILENNKLKSSQIHKFIIAGNSVMSHLFLGGGKTGLERVPFRSGLEGKGLIRFSAADISLPEACRSLFLPVLSGFIGGDTAAANLATGLDRKNGVRLLVDLGTNGEIVLALNGKLYATSTAAGPAFEGTGMACGMPAVYGAIEEITDEGNLKIIGDEKPLGFCGSGYISAVSYLLTTGKLQSSGLLEPDETGIRRWSPVSDESRITINQDDIRKFQLAKGAVAAGIQILLREIKIDASDLEQVYLTGSFGNRINKVAAIRTGLLPQVLPGKITMLDNGAGRGAALCLNDTYLARAQALAANVEALNLAAHPEFQEIFVENMRFPEGESP